MSGVEELKSLHTALIDARNGYDEAIKDAEKPDLGAIFEKVRRCHARALDDVRRMLAARGAEPDERGSFMTTVHEAVIGVRAAVGSLNRNSLAAFADGEEYTVASYEKVIAVNPADGETLQRHKAALQGVIAEMRAMAAK